MKLNIIQYRKFWFVISSLLVGLSILAIAVWGLRFSIDFTGGSLMELAFAARPAAVDVRTMLSDKGYPATVQLTGESGVLVRLSDLSEAKHQEVLSALKEKFGAVEELRFDSIGPVIGKELRTGAVFAIILTLILIGIYVAFAFRHAAGQVASWKYGTLTILAAFHDILIPMGVFAVLGHFYGWEVGTSFVAAILTIMGYSINDTIVVFDRTRENLKNYVGENLAETVDTSINQTFARSMNTTITTLLALVAVYFFGGDTTRPFAMALIVGIAVGAYSSICLASPLLVAWGNRRNS